MLLTLVLNNDGQFNVDTLGDHKVSLILELILDEKINSFIRINTELTRKALLAIRYSRIARINFRSLDLT